MSPASFAAALWQVPFLDRDAWVDRVLGLDGPPEDGPDLPSGGVPYLPCATDVLLRMVERASIRASDVFVDIGAGVGRAAAVVSLLTGARAVGVEVQHGLVTEARALAARLKLERVSFAHGDAVALGSELSAGTVFFLYCPFGGERLHSVLATLETVARSRPIRICCVDLVLPDCDWLEALTPETPELAIYRSTRGHGGDDTSPRHQQR